MSLIAILDVAHPDLALTPTIRECPDATVRVVPHSTTDPETGLFFFLVESADETIETAFDDDHTVTDWTLVNDFGTTGIYQLQHGDETILLSPKVAELGGLMLRAESNDRGWTVRLHLPDREALATLWEYCEDEDITFELYRMFRQEEWVDGLSPELTDQQRAALVNAYEEGYFEEPRETSLEELADQLDISPTAVGGRIRRGTGKLVETTLLEE
ncbi:helix-turn-helix domain-containing protein [Natronococcus wangiae]|uniref:helix-turn-helix domain-containing protein n=1 Tax=Natronococcus wangiae TaxID=3068275 RepID=UPI00273E1ECD|nr:helix-turn-helix domain-containing protein [Natronococcus sp. AD5]